MYLMFALSGNLYAVGTFSAFMPKLVNIVVRVLLVEVAVIATNVTPGGISDLSSASLLYS